MGEQLDRARFKCIPEESGKQLSQFIEETIEKGSAIIIDGWTGYSFLNKSDQYKHGIKIISGSGKEVHELLPHVHFIDSLLKRWINGTHQGNVSTKYLSCYLDQFAFQFN